MHSDCLGLKRMARNHATLTFATIYRQSSAQWSEGERKEDTYYHWIRRDKVKMHDKITSLLTVIKGIISGPWVRKYELNLFLWEKSFNFIISGGQNWNSDGNEGNCVQKERTSEMWWCNWRGRIIECLPVRDTQMKLIECLLYLKITVRFTSDGHSPFRQLVQWTFMWMWLS